MCDRVSEGRWWDELPKEALTALMQAHDRVCPRNPLVALGAKQAATITRLQGELQACMAMLDEISGVVGFPGTIALEKHGLSDRLPDVVRYCHRVWLAQTHAADQRVISEQARADKAEVTLAALANSAVAKLAELHAHVDHLRAALKDAAASLESIAARSHPDGLCDCRLGVKQNRRKNCPKWKEVRR